MPREIYSTSGRLYTDIAFRMGRLAKKNTRFSIRLELVFVVWPEKWEANTAEGYKMKYVRFSLEQNLLGRFVMK